MVLEIALNVNSLPGLAEFKLFSEENLVQDHFWQHQSKIFLTVLSKIMLLHHPASV